MYNFLVLLTVLYCREKLTIKAKDKNQNYSSLNEIQEMNGKIYSDGLQKNEDIIKELKTEAMLENISKYRDNLI
jgi:hypothetical protein